VSRAKKKRNPLVVGSLTFVDFQVSFLGTTTGQVGAALTGKSTQTTPVKVGVGESVRVHTRYSLRDSIHNIGGIPVIIYLIGLVDDREYQRDALLLLHKTLSYSARNFREMEEIGESMAIPKNYES